MSWRGWRKIEPDLHFDGEDESVKRFLLATRLIIAQIAEILRPRAGLGLMKSRPPRRKTMPVKTRR